MAEKASRRFRRIRNPDGAVLSTVSRALLSQDGLTFKDIDGSGTVSVVNDWRRPAAERAAAYVKLLTVPEKIAQLFVADWRMAKYPAAGPTPPGLKIPSTTRREFWTRPSATPKASSANSTSSAPPRC